jgi:hypothetical protein
MKKMKVSDLTGSELDYWVAKSQGFHVYMEGNKKCCDLIIDWNFIMKIMEKDNQHVSLFTKECYFDYGMNGSDPAWSVKSTGTDRLEAIKRCIVKRKYGDEVNEVVD